MASTTEKKKEKEKNTLNNRGLLSSMETFLVSSSEVKQNSRIQILLRTLFHGTLLET